MNIFDSYTQRIRASIQQDKINKSRNEGSSNFSGGDTRVKSKSRGIGAIGSIPRSMRPENSLLTLNQVIKQVDFSNALIGQHPDFRYLIGTEEMEMHYITSVFMDIKGSTQMHDVYDLETQLNITNAILSAAIHVCLLFGGNIQRLQGDGVFVYFGGKNVAKEESVRQAVTAAAMFTYFVKNDLQKLFEEDGVENISTRTGIDFGDDHEVLWGNFGIGSCVELTTISLHTSLASKCQQNAGRNGIVVGRHVKEFLPNEEQYFDYVKDSKGDPDYYVYIGRKKGLNYNQYVFNWFSFLKSLSYIQSGDDGNLYVVSPQQQEEDRLNSLRRAASVIQGGCAFTDIKGHISSDPAGVQNQPHRFHHE